MASEIRMTIEFAYHDVVRMNNRIEGKQWAPSIIESKGNNGLLQPSFTNQRELCWSILQVHDTLTSNYMRFTDITEFSLLHS